MDYNNERDRKLYGYDAGNIIDGEVVYDEEKKEYVIKDDEGVGFSSQELFKGLLGKRIRFTCISFESIEEIERILLRAESVKDTN